MILVKNLKDWLAQFPDDAKVEAVDMKDNTVLVDLKVITHFDANVIGVNTIGIE